MNSTQINTLKIVLHFTLFCACSLCFAESSRNVKINVACCSMRADLLSFCMVFRFPEKVQGGSLISFPDPFKLEPGSFPVQGVVCVEGSGELPCLHMLFLLLWKVEIIGQINGAP